jgi:hypothetical protein
MYSVQWFAPLQNQLRVEERSSETVQRKPLQVSVNVPIIVHKAKASVANRLAAGSSGSSFTSSSS